MAATGCRQERIDSSALLAQAWALLSGHTTELWQRVVLARHAAAALK